MEKAALAWGIQQARNTRIAFEAVVIIDADSCRSTFMAFNAELQAGRQAAGL
jgi:hypothetical protein